MKLKIFSLFLLVNIINVGLSVKILGVFPMPSKSHWILGSALMKELAKSGHEVTIISPYPLKQPLENYTDIAIVDLLANFESMTDTLIERLKESKFNQYFHLTDGGFQVTNYTLHHPKVQALMKSDAKFDLIVLPIFMSEAMLGFSHYYKAPLVAMSSFGLSSWLNEILYAPTPASYVPHLYLGFTDHMTFLQRFTNFAFMIVEYFLIEYTYNHKHSQLYEKIFPNPKPSYDKMKKTAVSLALINNHVSLNFPQPYMQNMIQICGMHINRKPNPLPKDIKTFIESSKDGIIYFAMGSNLKPSLFPKSTVMALYTALTKQKQKVLWLWNDPDSFEKSDNIMISKWFPQDDILAHRNIKLFITHGGMLSCTESFYHGVPVVGIPVFADQKMNMAKIAQQGWGVRVDYDNITETSITWAINEVIGNRKYKNKVAEISLRFRDQPMPPMETAKYWVEYIIRHKGAPHLRSAALDLPFYQYYLLDVCGVMLLFLLILILLVRFLFKLMCSKLFGQRSNLINETNKKIN